MVKVCHVTSAHCSNDVRIFYKECASLAKAGYETYLVARGESREEKNVHVIGVGQAPSNRIRRMTQFSKRVYENALAVNADFYHIHDPELLPYALNLKKLGKKVIFDSHEMYAEQIIIKPYIPKWFRKYLAFAYDKYQNYVFRRLDAVIFPCTYEGIHPFAGKCRIVETIDNYPLLEEFYERFDADAEKEANSICYTGGLTNSRGITNLVEAMEKIDGRLFLAGSFSPSGYEDTLKSLPGWDKVDYLGQLDRKEVRALVQKVMVGASMTLMVGQYNRQDNLSTKAYEYMSLGVPVLLTKAQYNEKVNSKYGFGICVDPSIIDEIAGAVDFLFSHPEEARQMGLNGRKAVEQEFNWGTQEKKLLALYQNLCTD